MINLIPIEEQKNTTKGFYFRLVIVFFFLFTFCVSIASITLIPSYFLVFNKEKVAEIKLEIQKNEIIPQLDQHTLSLIKDVDKKLDIIENTSKNKFLVSQEVISQIVKIKMSDIKITRILFENDIINGKKVSIYGTAPDRERLLLFRRALEENSVFSKVDLPVSNFIKGSDIQFYLNLVIS
ncbi:MAG: hypothetical protein ABH951_02135 [Patescibacteria group bacterium]